MINVFINLISIIILGIIQVSFLAAWVPPVSSLNLILSLVIFLSVIMNYQKGLWWALGGGLFLELYAGSLFGFTTLSLILVVIGVNFLFNNFFTNRSLYSLLILGFIGTAAYNLIILFFNLLLIAFGLLESSLEFSFWFQFFWQPIFNLLILFIIFFAYYISTGRLKNMFLSSSTSYEIKG